MGNRVNSQLFKIVSVLCLIAVSFYSLLQPLPFGSTVYAEGNGEMSFYVSPDGNDNNDGSIDNPFHTLQKARDVIRGINGDMNGDIVVYLRGGQYAVSESILFDETDSGTNGHNIIYRNYPGETPVISGGQKIGGWTEENGIFKANADGLKFRDLWVNGKRAVRARSPSFRIVDWDKDNRLINVEASSVAPWGGHLDPQVEIVINQHWVRSYSRLQDFSVQGSSAALELIEDAKNKIFNAQYPDKSANLSFRFENSKVYLDKPGEWLLNESEGMLYYIPLEGEQPTTIDARIGTLETFIDFKGADKNNRVKNIKISGITFEYTKYQYPIDVNYVIPGQGGLADGVYADSRRPPAAIQLEAADNITLERNVIRHTGSTAIDIRGSSRDNEVVGNAIMDIGGSGIFEGLFSEPEANTTDPSLITKGNVIRNNYLNGISLTSCGVGIISGYTQDVRIENNEVSHADYSGISVGWGWTANNSSLMNNVIRNNNIYEVMKQLADGAAIYTLSKTPGSEISGNYIHDIDSSELASNYPVASIYLDQETWGYDITDNVFTRVGQGFNFNVVADAGNTFRNNDSQDPEIIDGAGLQPEFWDIVPDAILQHSGENLTAVDRGSFRISGTVANPDETDGNTVVSILKNNSEVWSTTLLGQTEASYNINLDVEPGDVISFGMADHAIWQSRIKPELYTPRLVIDHVEFDGMEAGETKIDHRNKVITVMANPDVDISNLDVTLGTPPGTILERVGGESKDYSSDVVYKVLMNNGPENLDFVDGVKYKYWKLKVLRDAELISVSGYNLANQLDDADNWAVQGGTKTTGTNSLTFNGGYTFYQGKPFENELLEFNMKTNSNGWPSIVTRAQDSSKDPIGAGGAGYITVIKPEGIELQRFNDGARTVFFGNINGVKGKYGDVIPNAAFDFEKDNLVQVGTLNTDEGVRLVMYINGKLVYDCLDTDEGKIEEAGYFGTYQAGNVIKLSKAPVVVQLNDMIGDAESWHASAGPAEATSNSLTFHDGYSIYQGKRFEDELLEFNMKTNNNGWPSIVFRVQDSSKDPIGAGSAGYITVIKPEGIELQRFNDGARTVFYGNIDGVQGKYGDVIPNAAFDYAKDNLVQAGAVNTDDGVRLVMYINGKLVFDCLDTDEGKIGDAGYFGTYQAGNVIKLSKSPVVVQLNDMIGDAESWHASAGPAEATSNSLTLHDGYSIYQGKRFENELLEFNMKTNNNGWPSIVFRVQDSSKDPIGAGSAGYITVIKPEGIELQRFNDGARTVFYGNIDGVQGKYGDVIPNAAFDYAKDNLVQAGAVNTDDGVRLVMYINGKLVFDCLDTDEGKIEDAGYFGTYQAGNVIKLSKGFTASNGEAMDIRPLLLLEIGKAEATLSHADIGNDYGQYPLWAKEYLQSMINNAQNRYEEATSTEAALTEELGLLKSAEQAFAKSQNILQNIALGKSVTSSEAGNILAGYGPDKAVDDVISFGNGWSAESAVWGDKPKVKPWLTIDLGNSYVINGVEVVARPDGLYDGERKTFQIQASNDPNFVEGSYTVLGEVGTTPFEGASWVLEVTDGHAYRYIRYAKTNIDYAFVSEIKVLSAHSPEVYSVSGVIRDSSDQPLSGATVNLYSFEDQNVSLGTAISGEDGTYQISPSPVAGKYVVRVSREGYTETSATIYIPFANVSNANIDLQSESPEMPGDFIVETPVFTDAAGNPVEKLAASSGLYASVTITNKLVQPGDACLILALYAPDGTFADAAYTEGEIPAEDTVTLRAGLTLPADVNGYYIKAFVWDSLERMHPLSNAVTFRS